MLLHNAQRKELQRETAQAAGHPYLIDGNPVKLKLASMSRIAAYLSGGRGLDGLDGKIVAVLHIYPKTRGKNHDHFSDLLTTVASEPRDSTACLLDFLDAVHFLYSKEAPGFRKAFEGVIRLPRYQTINELSPYLKAPITVPGISMFNDFSGFDSLPLTFENGRPHRGYMRVAPALPELVAAAGNGSSGGGRGAASLLEPDVDRKEELPILGVVGSYAPSAPPLLEGVGAPVPSAPPWEPERYESLYKVSDGPTPAGFATASAAGAGWPLPRLVLPPPPSTEKPSIPTEKLFIPDKPIPGPATQAVVFAAVLTSEPTAPTHLITETPGTEPRS